MRPPESSAVAASARALPSLAIQEIARCAGRSCGFGLRGVRSPESAPTARDGRRARQVRAWGDDAASAGARGHLPRHVVRGRAVARCAACTTPWPRRWRSGIRMPRRRCGSDTSTSSSPTCPPPSPRSNPATPPWSCRCCSRPGTTCTSTSPRPSRPRRSAPSCSPAPSGPTTGSRPCCCDACARRACAPTTGSCSPSRGRATGVPSTTAGTWPPGSPRHPLATSRSASCRRPSRACPTRSRRPDRMPAPTAAGSWSRTTCSRPGFFDDLARAAGADVTARPLLVPDEPAPPELVEIVLDRYDAAPGPRLSAATQHPLPSPSARPASAHRATPKRSRSSTTAPRAGATPCVEQRRRVTQCDTA